MKKLITILLSSTVFLNLAIGQNSPMVIAGDVKVAEAGKMYSKGPISVKATDDQKGVIVNEGELTLNEGIIFYSNDERDGLLKNTATVNYTPDTDVSKFQVRKSFNIPEKYYIVSFPFDVDLTQVQNADPTGDAPDLNENFWIFDYDSQKRADEGKPEGNWRWLTFDTGDKILKAGTGYQITTQFGGPVELLFQPTATTDIASILEYSDKTRELIHYNNNGKFFENNAYSEGWNYIGGLNTSSFLLSSSTVSDATRKSPRAIYYLNENDIYEAIPVNMEGVTAVVSPYTPFFVQTDTSQVDTNGKHYVMDFHYLAPGLSSNDPDPIDFRSENTTSEDVFSVSLNGESDYSDITYIALGDKYKEGINTSEDASKLFSSGVQQLWSLVGTYPLVVNSLPFTETREIPLGVSTPSGGQYTFELDELAHNSIESVTLIDKEAKTKTDMLTKAYSFNVSDAINTTDRFLLLINKTITSMDEIPSISEIYAYTEDNILTVKNLVIGDNVQILDLAGRTIASNVAVNEELSFPLNQKGVYLVNVKGERSVVLKVLNK